jgi:hypothetical protein
MKHLLVVFAAAGLICAADLKLGKPLDAHPPIALATLLAHSDDYVGKTVQVKGKIAAVCQEMGCWIDLVNDSGQKLRIKVNDGEIEFPKDSAGKTAIAEGKFTKVVLTRDEAIEQAKEAASESGKKFDASSIKSGATYYQIQGTGAVILGGN